MQHDTPFGKLLAKASSNYRLFSGAPKRAKNNTPNYIVFKVKIKLINVKQVL
jgi:hypothetical protein